MSILILAGVCNNSLATESTAGTGRSEHGPDDATEQAIESTDAAAAEVAKDEPTQGDKELEPTGAVSSDPTTDLSDAGSTQMRADARLQPSSPEIEETPTDPSIPETRAPQIEETPVASGAGVDQEVPEARAGKDGMDMAAVIALVKQQQEQLSRQEELLADQSRQLDRLREELDALRAPPVSDQSPSQKAVVDLETVPVDIEAPGEQQVAVIDLEQDAELAQEEEREDKTTREQTTSEAVAKAQADDPTELDLTDFPGAWRLPGTRAALAIGGFVKSTIVYNWDPLEINDRFIVGSIPVDSTVAEFEEAESSITASQSRLNFDLREPTDVGLLRAFVEGDFAENNDTFRLRHAFGQWNRMLAGKTWSTFVDTQATPEEIDFEGLNGRINLRQSQVRLSPRYGETFQFQFSMEDPNPQVQGGDGVTRAPDMVVSGRFQPNELLHTKVALLARQIRAQRDALGGGGVEKEYGWGLTVSGRYSTPDLGAKDSLLFQVNVGEGIGRYVNDLASVGQYDGIFNPRTGDLKLFDVISGYVSLQHWWGGTMRSNFTLGYVGLDNPGFVEGDAYKQTVRASTNFMWTPTPRIDLGFEFLFGRRENQDGSNGDAKQIQAAARYRFN